MELRRDKLLSYDPVRKLAVYAQFDPLPDGQMKVVAWYCQEVPDGWKDQNREIGEVQPSSLIGNTQHHWRHVARIPDAVHNELTEKYGNPVRDEDAAKTWKKRVFNDSEYRDLRTWGGKI